MIDWKKICVSPSSSIIETMRLIDQTATQFAMVVDEQYKLLGTITDGDIRRAILKGLNLNEMSSLAMKTSPAVGTEDSTEEELEAIFNQKKIFHIPIVNNQGKVIAVRSMHDKNLENLTNPTPIILMAGGLGSRLGDLTTNCPKPLLKVGNKPILEIILENFRKQGFVNFYFSVNYKSEMIEAYFENGKKYDVNIHYLRESKKLGTAGALSLINLPITHPIIVMNGDLLTKIDFNKLLNYHRLNKHVATMCVRQYDFQVPYGVIKTNEGQIQGIDEKPIQQFFVNAGIYVLNPELLARIPQNEYYDMPTLFNQIIGEQLSVGAFPVHEYWLDIGKKDDFDKAQDDFNNF